MQGRRKQDDGSSGKQRAYSNGSGRQRGIPQRPPNMARVKQPPVSPRVARPQREAPQPAGCGRRLLIWSFILIACTALAFFIGYAVINFSAATSSAGDAAASATDFLSSLNNQNYEQAYNDLGPAITIPVSPDQFKELAQDDDRCYGTVTNYSEVANSAVQNNAQSYTFSFSITRSKLAHPYTLRMIIQQDTTSGRWKISSYGNNNDLGPGAPPCS